MDELPNCKGSSNGLTEHKPRTGTGWQDADPANPCPACGAVSGCRVNGAGNQTSAACLNITYSPQKKEKDGLVYHLYDGPAVAKARQQLEIERTITLLTEPGATFEVRVLDIRTGRGRPHGAAGYFRDPAGAAGAVMDYEATVKPGGIYITLNPPDPATHARSPDKITDYQEPTTSDKDIRRRRWLILDCDPARPSGVCATQEQLDAAERFAGMVKDWLKTSHGFPDPVEGMSGNGYYLLYRIELPNDDESKVLIQRTLKAVNYEVLPVYFREGDPPKVQVDESMSNAARIARVLGTTNRKGHHTKERPHRRSRLVRVPEPLAVVPVAALRAVADTLPGPAASPCRSPFTAKAGPSANGRAFSSKLMVDVWLTARGVPFTTKTVADGRTAYLITCPFDAGHDRGETCVMQAPDGKLSAKCWHDSCSGNGWQEFKARIGPPDPEHWDPPLRPRGRPAERTTITEPENDVVAALLEKAKSDPQAAIDQALQDPALGILAKMVEAAPGNLEAVYRQLQQAGGKTREISGLRSAVKAEGKRLKKERAKEAKAAQSQARTASTTDETGKEIILRFSNFFEETIERGDSLQTIQVGYPIQHLASQVWKLTKDWPRLVDNLLFAQRDYEPVWLEKPPALMAWISSHLPGNWNINLSGVLDEQPRGEPVNMLEWADGRNMVSQERFFAYLTQVSEKYDAVERAPHWPALPNTYYMHQPPEGGDGAALRELIGRFCPATLADHDLILGFFLSLLWGGPPGQRPAWLFTAEDEDDEEKGRGVGKTTLAELGAALVGGAISVSANEDRRDMLIRLLSPDALDKRVVLLDNVKTMKFSWAELEALVTCEVVSGRRLFHGEGRRPNTLTWAITLNGATLSKDMAQRCVIVKLRRPRRDPDWKENAVAYIRERRWAIIGDILSVLKEPADRLARHSRWGAWEEAVLARVGDPAECQKVIEERQGVVDDDSHEAEIVREALVAELRARGHCPETEAVWFPARVAAEVVNQATMEKWPTNKANTYLGLLHIPELRRSNRQQRGWVWTGLKAGMETAVAIQPKPTWPNGH